jgi:hypothetical protein
LARLIAALDSKRFAEREAAEDELVRLGERCLPALKAFLAGRPSLEARKRVETILPLIEKLPPRGGALRDWRAVRVLEEIGSEDAKALLRALAGGARDVPLTRESKAALGRLAP